MSLSGRGRLGPRKWKGMFWCPGDRCSRSFWTWCTVCRELVFVLDLTYCNDTSLSLHCDGYVRLRRYTLLSSIVLLNLSTALDSELRLSYHTAYPAGILADGAASLVSPTYDLRDAFLPCDSVARKISMRDYSDGDGMPL